MQAEAEAAFHLAFYVAEMTGRSEAGEIDEEESLLLRLLTPVMKLTTGRQAVHVASEAGVFCEPASAAPVAGLLRLSREQPKRFAGQRIVAVLTGHGLKDPQSAMAAAPPLAGAIDPEALEAALR